MPATADHVETYKNEGYVLIENLIPADLIDAAFQRALQVIEGEHEWEPRHFQMVDPEKYRNGNGDPIPIGIQRPGLVEDVFADVANHPNLSAAMSELLDGPVELFTDQIGMKHGFLNEEQGGRSYYHQDSYYWKIKPELGCNCWLPFCPVGVDAIAIGVMPGTHKDMELVEHEDYFDDPNWFACGRDTPIPRHRIPDRLVDYSKEIVFPMKPGDGLFFGNYTWHRSEPNRSGETKAFYGVAYRRSDVEDFKVTRK